MKLYSYIVKRDFGFAPNPFPGYCTLAPCKPRIRSVAVVGDWIVGTGSATKYRYSGRLIYAMQVNEVMDFDHYWNDSRFLGKRPVLNGSLVQLYGDNIYHREDGGWVQVNSHHSLEDGHPNMVNVERDTGANRVLISTRFVYFGSSAPMIPEEIRNCCPTGKDLCCTRPNHKKFNNQTAMAFQRWLESQNCWGLQGWPLEFNNHPRH